MYKRGDKGGQEDVSNTTAVEAMCIRDLYVECSMFLQQHDTMHDCPGDGTVRICERHRLLQFHDCTYLSSGPTDSGDTTSQ
jgi:predicted nucleic acid binding AN1-type Zn finger protein